MNENLNSTQVNVLLNLLITGDEPKQSKVKPLLNPKQRNQLVQDGFIELEKRQRALHIVLTDKAWAWVNDHLGELGSYRLYLSLASIRSLMSKLNVFMKKNKTSLAEIFCPAEADESISKTDSFASVEEKIKKAYLIASGGKWSARIRLADLRRHLPGIERKTVDGAIRFMQLNQKLVLYRMDNPSEITSEDDRASITIMGQQNHIIYMEGLGK